MPAQNDPADLAALVQDRHGQRLLQQTVSQQHFDPRQQAVFGPLPLREQLTISGVDPSLGDRFGGSNQGQCFSRCPGVVKHHSGFHGVVDGAGDQVQIVIGIDLERQHAQQGHGSAGQSHRDQCYPKMPTAQHRAQSAPIFRGSGSCHGCAARRRDSCNTLG